MSQFHAIARRDALPATPEILPHELANALDAFPQVQVLSLDCFDTLLWRDSHAPRDIFAALPDATPLQRAGAEALARRIARARGRDEVSIAEIYAVLMPGASPAAQRGAIAAELAAEARHCFAFAPAVALMRAAKARGVGIIIVSDTYLDAAQLRGLIAAAAGEDIAGLIDRIFTSSAYGKPKAGGLYAEVLRRLKTAPDRILHIGDNLAADGDGVAPYGAHTLYLRQFAVATQQRLRLEAGMAAMIHAPAPDAIAQPQPHRATLALIEPQLADPAERLGATVLGPVFAGFERWLQAQAALLGGRGGTVHWLFVMRDGWLPQRIHQAMTGDAGHTIEISRFTATAASIARASDIARHVEMELGTVPDAIARQLLMPEAEITALLAGRTPQAASMALLAAARRPDRQQAVLRATRGLARRLVEHVRATVAPAPGDTLMLIDLGYNGTVQNRIDALLRDALGVHVAGRYLLLRETDRPGLDKAGFISGADHDAPTLEALCAQVAVIEQLATRAIGSVVDYTGAGEPIRTANDIKPAQSAVREAVQAGCLRFARAHDMAAIRRVPASDAGWPQGAAAALTRLMYLPQPDELAVIARFEHDINLGSGRTVALFDPAESAVGLRRRGLFYMKGASRMYLPAELAGAGLDMRLSLFAHKRFALPFAFADAGNGPRLPIAHIDAQQAVPGEIATTMTHDGWRLAAIPVAAQTGIALRFGLCCEWVQIDQIATLAIADFLSEVADAEVAVAVTPVLDAMHESAPGLYRCENEHSLMLIPPLPVSAGEAMMLAVVFRVVVDR